MDDENRDIISEETEQKQRNMKEKRIDDMFVELFLRIYFEDGGKDPSKMFQSTEDLIIHIINKRLNNMPFYLQRRITQAIKEKTEPRRM